MSSSSSARISISSDEVNLLVYRYLVESGFKHSSFVFHGESLLQRTPNLLQADLPPGSLVTLLQKALLFLYVESHVANDGKAIKCDEPFSILRVHDHDHGPIESLVAEANGEAELGSTNKAPSVKRQKNGNNGSTSSSSVTSHSVVAGQEASSTLTPNLEQVAVTKTDDTDMIEVGRTTESPPASMMLVESSSVKRMESEHLPTIQQQLEKPTLENILDTPLPEQ